MPNRFQLRGNVRRGNSLIEFAMLLPWYVIIFVVVFDFGFYGYALIALEDGVRVAALSASQTPSLAGNSTTACTYVLGALKYLPNIETAVTTCTASPIVVTATYGIASGPDGGPATTVSATYTTSQMLPIPGVMTGQVTITRSIQMRVRL